MPSAYPSGLDALSTSFDDATAMAGNHADAHNDERAAINALEAELGLDPAGSYATVKDRLDATGPSLTTRTVTTAPTITATDMVLLCNVTSASFNVQLPLATLDRRLIIKNIATNANIATVVPNGSQKIDKQGSYALPSLETLSIVGDGTGWWII